MSNDTQKLSDRIPNPSLVTDLLAQLQEQVQGIGVPDVPLGPIMDVAARMNITLPDPSSWSSVIPTDVTQGMQAFPDPATLAQPFQAPLEHFKQVATFDFAGEIKKIQTQLEALSPASQDDPKAFLDGLAGSLAVVSDTMRQSPLTQLIIDFGTFAGIEDLAALPDNAAELMTRLQTILKERVGGVLLGIAALGSTLTLSGETERLVEMLAGLFSMEETQTRFQGLLHAYGEGAQDLAAQLTALDLNDAAQVDQMKAALQTAGGTFTTFHQRLVRDLAFTEASVGMLNLETLQAQFEKAGDVLTGIDAAPLQALAESFQAAVTALQSKLALPDGLDATQFAAMIKSGLDLVVQELDRIDPSKLQSVLDDTLGVIKEPLKQVEAIKVQVETLVRDAYQAVQAVLAQVDLTPVRATFEQAMHQVESKLQEVEGLLTTVRTGIEDGLNQVKGALDGARTFLLDPQNGLKAQIEAAFNTVLSLFQQLNIQGVLDEIRGQLESITNELKKIEFAPVIDATIDAIEGVADVIKAVAPLLFTDDLKQKLKDAGEFLKQLDFDAVRSTLIAGFDEILETIDQDALGRFEEEYQKVLDAVDQLDPAPMLQQLQAEVFDPLVAELEKIDPAKLLQPLQEAFDAAREALAGFDPAQTFSFITDLFKEITDTFNEISPDSLLAPLEEAIADIRTTVTESLRLDDLAGLLDSVDTHIAPLLDALNIAEWLGKLAPGVAALRQAIQQLNPADLLAPLAAIFRRVFAATGLKLNKAGLGRFVEAIKTGQAQLGSRFETLHQQLTQMQTQLTQLDVQAFLLTLRTRHDALKAALAGLDSSLPAHAELSRLVDALDPMPVLAPLGSKITRVQTAVTETAGAFGQMLQKLGPAFQQVDTMLETFKTLLNPFDVLKTAFRDLVQPVISGTPAENLRDLLLQFIDVIDPTQWQTELEAVGQAVKDKLSVLISDVVLNPIRETINNIKGLVNLLDISALSDAIRGVHADVEKLLDQFDPTPFLEEVNETYQRVLGVLDHLDPKDLIAQIDQLYKEDVVGVVKAISPEELLLEPLRALFDQIKALLGALDITTIFEPVLEHLNLLRDQLDEGLSKTGDAYKDMLQALPA